MMSLRNVALFASLIFIFSTDLWAQEPRVLEGRAAHAAFPGAEVVRLSDRSDAPSFIRFRPHKQFERGQWELLTKKALKMGDEDGLKFLNMQKDELGHTHYRYQQTFRGFPVEGSMYLLHEKEGKFYAINGEFYTDLNINTQASLDEATALQAALAHVGADVYKWEVPEEEAFIRRHENDFLATWRPQAEKVIIAKDGDVWEGDFRFAYRFDIYAHEPMGRQDVYVDAHTGEILWFEDQIHTADVVGTAVTAYSGTVPMTADSYSGGYRLRESGRGNGIETYDMNNGTNYNNAVDFTDSDNIWNNVNAQQDEVATDAHWGAEQTYDYFFTRHNRNSIDGNGFTLISYVHYDNNYNNAFWNGNYMTYGDGNGSTFSPLTALDVTGHEIAHGLTNFTANLVYAYESGALNESFSDIFGTAIENYARPNNWDWIIGGDMTPSGNGIRNMQNPGLFNDPDTYAGPNYYYGAGDNGGVHINSGVQNHWYYIMVQGESGINGVGDPYNVTGIGATKADAIAFRNLTIYLTPNSQYTDARFFAMQSAIDLYGSCTPEVRATVEAWHAVGVGSPYVNSVLSDFSASPDTFCTAPAQVSFSNFSMNGSTFTWDFGDGNTSNAVAPSHTYSNLGNYTVSLIVDGGSCGVDSMIRNQYISVDTANDCIVILNNGSNPTQTACSGTLYDTGGPNGDYLQNSNSSITIAPIGAATVTLNFNSFSFESGFDYLRIYDGPNTSSPLIGQFDGTNLPGNGSITSSGSSITLVEDTDGGVEQSGFDLDWQCTLPTTPPIADFAADDTLSCSGLVQFRDLSTNGATAWAWDFGDGFTSSQQNPLHTYQNNGTYTVSMIATNQIGSDTVVKVTYVRVSRAAGPQVDGANLCGPGSVTLVANGNGNFYWYDAQNGGNLVFNGNPFVTPQLTATTNYYVEERTPGSQGFVGPQDNNSVGQGGYHGNGSTQYLNFTVQSSIVFVSAWVNPDGAGNRTINLWDSQGNLLRDTTLNIGANPQRITLNWSIAPGIYRIGGTQMDLYRNNSGPNYPYNLINKVSITGSSAGPDYYYYLYDWEVRGPDCKSFRTPVAVNLLSMNPPVAAINSSNGQSFCDNANTVLTASGGSSFLWSNGITTASQTITAAGTYSVTVTDANGCQDDDMISLSVNASPTASFTYSANLLQHTFTDVSTGGSSWAWDFGDGNSSTQQNPAHSFGMAGTYTVTLIVTANGCSDTTSQVLDVIAIGLDDLSNGINAQVWPNPFENRFAMLLDLAASGKLSIELFDLPGQRVAAIYDGEAAAGEFRYEWQVPNGLAEGTYLLRIRQGEKVLVKRMVLMR